MKNIVRYIPIIFTLVLITSCTKGSKAPVTTSTSGTITLMCDNSFENIIQQEIDVFEFQYPKAHILARYLPRQDVIDSLMQFKTRAIVAARDLTTKENEENIKRLANFLFEKFHRYIDIYELKDILKEKFVEEANDIIKII